MKTSELKSHLSAHPERELRFVLPDGECVPIHAHITEAGRIDDKTFIDCGGTHRKSSTTTLQAWVADDIDHRLLPGKLAAILEMAAPIFNGDDLDVEVEYEGCAISQFPVVSAAVEEGALAFKLGSKHTDCLAKEFCKVEPDACCGEGDC